MSRALRVAALISGGGSNLKTLIDAQGSGRLAIELVQVISNREQAGGLDHARKAAIPYQVINRANAGPAGEDAAITAALQACAPDLVLLTGYLRILGAGPVTAFAGRMINQHPSLLPAYKGLHTYRRVLEAGDPVHGASIHFVTPELDDGPVIAQVQVPVQANDDESTLARRLNPREHALLLAVMELFAAGRVEESELGVQLDGQLLERPLRLDGDQLHA